MVGVWRDIRRFTDAAAWIDYLCIIERLTLKGMAPCLECHAFCHCTLSCRRQAVFSFLSFGIQ